MAPAALVALLFSAGAAASDREAGATVGPAAPRPLLRNSPAPPASGGTRDATGEASAWIRTTGALVAVVGLIVLLAWGYRKAAGLPAGLSRSRNLGLIEVVSRTALSPRTSLWLVRIGPRLVLLGGGADGLRALDVISDQGVVASLLGEAAQRRSDSSTAAFSHTLADESKHYSEPEADAGAGEPRLDAVRKKLAQTLERLQGAAST